ncbi:Ppx/GppA family phosphatase [Pontixanthobacter aestiaquae]|uniref:Ppx/GppA family phosphatase n=1 Tax=Pontixanthobacter aestiaquae TaxID=1509367 RepID=A0A844Z920_9SPHN|nr:Ppx/GppA family phosphatase [Pontixanthobacter aestiaquae]MDN3644684.1 Ppx/GppA family phosphatase [Pontixanthobacter aestiaquae]MXO84308.1 Ppx/GppA family phosphatase [Pontixanthobacter aestiaquae]
MALRSRSADRQGAFSGNRVERAIIDIGSNTVRLVLYGGSPRAPVVLFNEKVVAQLGREIAETGLLADAAVELAMRGLTRFALLLKELKVEVIDVVATAAVRAATNGPDFVKAVNALGLPVRILSGDEEARISAMGINGAFPGAKGVVADLGGGSLELVLIGDSDCGLATSLPLGTLRLPEHRGTNHADTKSNLSNVLAAADWLEHVDGALYLVGGTWRAMAVVAMEDRNYPLTDPHGFEMPLQDAQALAAKIADMEPEALNTSPRISTMRSQSLPNAGVLLSTLLERFTPEKIIFSSWGLREGVLFDELEEYARKQDPLLAGVGEFANLRGCPPALATQVAGWTVRAVPEMSQGSERLRLSATMLALASMQIEPNLRREIAMDWALHKRWIALDACGRAMMAAAVSANGNNCDMPDSVAELASPAQIEEAISWGLAIRLCRRLGGRSDRTFNVSDLRVESDDLVLSIEHSHRAFYGIPNEKDMDLLADRLGLNPVMRVLGEVEMGLLRQPDIELAK